MTNEDSIFTEIKLFSGLQQLVIHHKYLVKAAPLCIRIPTSKTRSPFVMRQDKWRIFWFHYKQLQSRNLCVWISVSLQHS